uniref:Uncharacterized protein n=1 Tax=Arundo donax TaxID=35708 RepID=A0A0A8XRR5_ARUDO
MLQPRTSKSMTESSSTYFLWTPMTIKIAFNISWHVLYERKDDPFKENNLI